MSYQKQQFGMMDEGYFVPKSQILSWINSLLQISITKIEALGSGSIYCQIFDVIHPGKINLAKINWKAKNDTDFLSNFRLLQTSFQKSGIKRHIEVQKLVKAKYQDNLQFIQWFKRYFDTNCGTKGQGYDAVQKRNKIIPDFGFCQKTVVPKVFSGAGQIVPKEKVTSPHHAKKQQIPTRLKSPRTIKTPITNTRVKTPIPDKKQQPKKVEVKKEQPKKKTIPVAPKTTTPIRHQVPKIDNHKKVVAPPADKKLKQLEQKLEMIKQIVSSEDGSDMKIDLIRQLLNIKKQVQQVPTTDNHKPENIIVNQQEQYVHESVTNNQDLLSHEQHQSEEAALEQVPVSEPAAQSQQNQFSQTHQKQSELQQKPDLSHVTQSEHEDDII